MVRKRRQELQAYPAAELKQVFAVRRFIGSVSKNPTQRYGHEQSQRNTPVECNSWTSVTRELIPNAVRCGTP